MNFMLVLRPGEICLYAYPLYIFPSILKIFKTLQDTVSHKCKKIAWKLSMLEAFKEIWLMKNDTIMLLAYFCIRNK